MSDLENDLVGLEELNLTEGDLRVHRFNTIMSRAPADFSYWSKAPYWSQDEAVALLLGRDPEIINWKNIERKDLGWSLSVTLMLDYGKLRNLVLRAADMGELGIRNSPAVVLEWAKKRGIDIPEPLREAVLAIEKNRIENAVEGETTQRLKVKEAEIARLEKRIEALEALVWEGFDAGQETYSKELAIAVEAHRAISQHWKKEGMSVKKQLSIWLKEHYPRLFNEERERIAKICNWQKTGGAPITP